jgi:VIT1/CCC1 family predicted Fe2+/Mn2+ transporter
MADLENRTLPQLIGDLSTDLTGLFRKESELVRAELSEKTRQLAKATGEMAAGAICLLAALLILLQAVVIALAKLVGAGWASLIVGIAVGLLGAVLVRTGAKSAEPHNLAPERTIRQVEKDARLAKEQVQ